jgi:hypothetical protein
MKHIIGIDNGLNGCACFLGPHEPYFFDTPTISITTAKKKRNKYDEMKMARFFKELKYQISVESQVFCFIEEVRYLPKQSSQSSGSIGYGYGLWRGLIAYAGLPVEVVSVRNWQKAFGIYGKGQQTKNASYMVAKRLHPCGQFTTVKGRVLDGRCDAFLIAEYGRRILK